MKKIIPILMLIIVCATLCVTAPSTKAQESHVAAQFVFQGTHDYGYSNPQVGVRLSGAMRFDNMVILGSFDAERAQKNFLNNGTDLHGTAGMRYYPLKFIYGEAFVGMGGQLNSQFTKTGMRMICGGGVSISDYVQIGANYLGSDHTVNDVSGARVYFDAFVPVTRRLYLKGSGQADFVGFSNDFAGNLRNIRAQRFGGAFGVALRF